MGPLHARRYARRAQHSLKSHVEPPLFNMPDLKNSYIYKDWILDLALAGKQEWSRFNLFHQCQKGVICRSKGVLKAREERDSKGWETKDFYTYCTGCHTPLPEAVEQQMRAMWNLLTKV